MIRFNSGPRPARRSRLLALWGALLLPVCLAFAAPLLAQETPPAPATPDSAAITETPAFLPPPVWISPTPDENGVIAVVVQPDESLWIIAARAGLTLPDLLALNNLTEADVIRPGDVIILAVGTPPPTAVSPEMMTPTATPPPPTLRPTQPPPAATICLSAFEDSNQNGIRDPDEPATPGVAFTVFNRDVVIGNIITDGRAEPHCLPGLAPGEYYVTRSILPGEILTTEGEWALVIANNSTLTQAFGSVRAAATPSPTAPALAAGGELPAAAAPESVPPAGPPATAPRSDALLWGGVGLLFVGGLLLLAAVLILLIRRTRA
jgi:hypothetical protein